MESKQGIFIISLDFEMFWAMLVKDEKGQKAYQDNIVGARAVIPKLLILFKTYHIHATWATVGFLFFKTKQELLQSLPAHIPAYKDPRISPYRHLQEIGSSETEDPLHYAASLIALIRTFPNQEISTHTFCHYNAKAEGQNEETFKDDLQQAISTAKKQGIITETLVFPHNNVNENYFPICKKLGIKAYRGTQAAWFHQGKNTIVKRIVRFTDRYFPIDKHNAFLKESIREKELLNIRASRFLYPYCQKLRFLETLRLHRITTAMSYAAKHGLVYHLWWHPYDFGVDQEKNLAFLEKILAHYSMLKNRYGMESFTMQETAHYI
jgi:hypothetical protein